MISSFALIPKFQAAFSGKKEEKTITTDKVVQQIIQNEEASVEDLTDDTELVAVIAAAIAAALAAGEDDGATVAAITAAIIAARAEEGCTTPFRVVSFKRANSRRKF